METKQMTRFFSSAFWAPTVCYIDFCIWKFPNSFSWGLPFGPFWSAKYLNFWDESCEIRILSRSIRETYTFRKVKDQVLLFLSSWEPNLSDLMIYDLFGQNFLFCICIYKCSKLLKKVGTFLQTIYKFQLFFIPVGRTYTAKYLLLLLSLSTWRSVNGS